MSAETISIVLYCTISMPLWIAHIIVMNRQQRAVDGSKQRYALTTLAISLTIPLVISLTLLAVFDFRIGSYPSSLFESILAILVLWRSRGLFKDDNWFNKQFKKLKNGLKNLGKQLSNVRLPSPLPSPA